MNMTEKITRRNLLLSSGLIIATLIILTERAFFFLHAGFFNNYEKALLEPIFVWLVAIFASTAILYFVQTRFFRLWLRYILCWYLPLGSVLTFLTSTTLSYTFPDRLGVATLLGWGLVILTAGFVLVHLVLDWKKKQRN